MEFDPEMLCAVIDNGSGAIKIGFSGVSTRKLIPNKNILEELSFQPLQANQRIQSKDRTDIIVGDEAVAKKRSLGEVYKLTKPIPHDRRPIRWDLLYEVWRHAFYSELRVTPDDTPTLMSSLPNMDDLKLSRMCEIMFMKLDVPCLSVADTGVLSLLATGRSTGTVIECGSGMTRSICVYEGLPVEYSIMKMENPTKIGDRIAGQTITDYLVKILSERGYEMTTNEEVEIVNDIKERLCFVCEDYEAMLTRPPTLHEYDEERGRMMCVYPNDDYAPSKEYELPDGSKMTIGSERFRAPEVLFKPSFLGYECLSLPEIISQSIEKIQDVDVRHEMYGNIVLSGGTMLIRGMEERIKKELVESCGRGFRESVRTISIPERRNNVWCGGSVLSSMNSFHREYIGKEYYEENGAKRVRQRCQMVAFDSDDGYLVYLRKKNVDEDIGERIGFIRQSMGGDKYDMFKLVNLKKIVIGGGSLEIQIFDVHLLFGFFT